MELEHLGTKELAFHITQFDWDLFWSIHEYELLYHTFGRHHFGKVNQTACAIARCAIVCIIIIISIIVIIIIVLIVGFITLIRSIKIK